MFCEKCGKALSGRYCGDCSWDSHKEELPSKELSKTFTEFLRQKGKSRTTTLPKKRKLDKRAVIETTIYSSILKQGADGTLKQEKGSRLPIKVNVEWGPYPLKQAVFEKFKRYNNNLALNSIEDFKLVYKNGDVIRHIPGTDIPFTLKGYKEDLGVGYNSLVVYLQEYMESSSSDEDEFPDASAFVKRYIL